MRLPDLALGARVSDYQLQAVLGQGATGRVYQAVVASSGAPVAIKVIGFPQQDEALRREIWKRFDREVAVLRALTHPHIVSVTDSGALEWQGELFPWIAMQLIPGARTIASVYRERRDLGWLLDRTGEILETLVHVHRLDIIHRDIKPDNVLVSDKGELFIVDFGLVRVVQVDRDRLTRTGQTLGTLQYMALEQIGSSKHVDARADLYSVGMLLFELVEEVQNWRDYMSDILCAQGIRITRPVPRPLAAFIERLAAPRMQDRYKSAQDALAALLTVRDTLGL